MTFSNAQCKTSMFHVSGKNFTGNEKFQGNIYLKPEESPEDRWFCVVNNMMSPYDLYETFSGFLFLVSKFSNLTNINRNGPNNSQKYNNKVLKNNKELLIN